ncbi:MAG: S9 family peptidase [Acidobacteria bacterium]|nr:S9 family peptidase [Acidobacteriota bacterium]
MRSRPALILSAAVATLLTASADGRTFTTEDVLRLEGFGVASGSPDGRFVAFVKVRSKVNAKLPIRSFMNGMDRSDVWLYDIETESSRQLTDGSRDGAGFFAPSWSPDGEQLAMLSTRGGTVTAWVWRRRGARLEQVSTETVELGKPLWISNREMVCATPAQGEQPVWFDLDVRGARSASAAWMRADSGAGATASAVVSPSGSGLRERRMGRLRRYDAVAKKAVTIADGTFTDLSVSPDGRWLAAYELAGRLGPVAGEALPNRNPSFYRLVVFDGSKRRSAVELSEMEEPLPGAVAWLKDGALAARIARRGVRTDWFAIGPDGARVNLTGKWDAAPGALVADAEGATFLGAYKGQLWRLAPGAAARALTNRAAIDVAAIAFSDSGALAVRGSRGGAMGWYALDQADGKVSALPVVEEGGEALAYVARHEALVFAAPDGRGRRALRMRSVGEAQARTIAVINTFLGEIDQGEFRSFRYRTAGGRELTAWLLLPPGHREGVRYPTVVSVYPGLVYSGEFRPRASVESASGYNPQLFAASGYAVLFPSIPLSAEGTPDEPYDRIREGVMPAVEAAVRLGFADGERVAVFGHSFGGYAAFALATQPSRFRAVIACSGFANLTSLYGAFDPRFRYEDEARNRLLFMVFAESGQFRLGSPPWADAARYARNSPLTFVDRVTTPVMILQGDQDYVPIQQGEEFFTALFRQRKAAVFVRYWGEGHSIESPANIRDMWTRISAFLGERL